jgi:hypothetical protein
VDQKQAGQPVAIILAWTLMKLVAHCMECVQGTQNIEREIHFADYIELGEEGFLELACPRGHKSIITVQEEKFEILFDFGGMALLDGYYREAVATVSTALERCLEFYITVVCLHLGIPEQEFAAAWKRISAQSERQLGAFLFLYLLNTKRQCDYLSDKAVKFRNDVVHKGYIPRRTEAIEYGEEVLKFIFRILTDLRRTAGPAIQQATMRHISQLQERAAGRGRATHMSIPTMIHMTLADELFGKKTFSEALEDLSGYRRKLYRA